MTTVTERKGASHAKENPKTGSNLVVVHKERYMRLNYDRFGKRGQPILTTPS